MYNNTDLDRLRDWLARGEASEILKTKEEEQEEQEEEEAASWGGIDIDALIISARKQDMYEEWIYMDDGNVPVPFYNVTREYITHDLLLMALLGLRKDGKLVKDFSRLYIFALLYNEVKDILAGHTDLDEAFNNLANQISSEFQMLRDEFSQLVDKILSLLSESAGGGTISVGGSKGMDSPVTPRSESDDQIFGSDIREHFKDDVPALFDLVTNEIPGDKWDTIKSNVTIEKLEVLKKVAIAFAIQVTGIEKADMMMDLKALRGSVGLKVSRAFRRAVFCSYIDAKKKKNLLDENVRLHLEEYERVNMENNCLCSPPDIGSQTGGAVQMRATVDISPTPRQRGHAMVFPRIKINKLSSTFNQILNNIGVCNILLYIWSLDDGDHKENLMIYAYQLIQYVTPWMRTGDEFLDDWGKFRQPQPDTTRFTTLIEIIIKYSHIHHKTLQENRMNLGERDASSPPHEVIGHNVIGLSMPSLEHVKNYMKLPLTHLNLNNFDATKIMTSPDQKNKFMELLELLTKILTAIRDRHAPENFICLISPYQLPLIYGGEYFQTFVLEYVTNFDKSAAATMIEYVKYVNLYEMHTEYLEWRYKGKFNLEELTTINNFMSALGID